MKQDLIKRYLIMAIGGMLIGVGVTFIVGGDLGGDSLTTLEQGLHVLTGISIPVSQIFVNAFFVVVLFFMDKKRLSIDTILCPLFISLGCSLSLMVVPAVSATVLRYVYLVIGLIIIGLGIGVGAQTPTGSNPYDGFVLSLSDKVHISYSLLRPICDLIILIIGILIGGSWGVGTVVALVCTGYIGNFFIKLLNKVFSK